MTGAAQQSIFEYIKEIHSDGYCIVVESQDNDAMIFFGLAAEAKLYEKINDKQIVTVQKVGRKQEVLDLLKTGKHYKIPELAKILGISDRNVSSQLSYLRADNYAIATDARGFKFLEV
jgi:biotin operon repressor